MDILETAAREQIFAGDVPTDSVQDQVWSTTRENAQKSLYFFSTAVLGFNKIERNPHLEICSFIQRIPKSRKVCLIPRDCYKSTIGSKSLPLWILIQKEFCGIPGREHRILCGSFSSENAKKQIKAIRHLIERNTMLQWLFPEIVPDFSKTTWTDSNLLFPRDGVYGEDTIEAAGVDTHLVSRHYTVQIKDDLEDEKAMQSPTVRKKVYDWYKSAEALFVDEQTAYDLLIGTRWGIDDLYAQVKTNESDTYEFLCRPLHWSRADLDADLREARESGRPSVYEMDPERYAPDPARTYYFFPKIFPADSCARIKAKQGSFMYSMLYLNNPKDPSLAEFREKDLRYYNFDIHGNLILELDNGEKETVVFDHLARVMFWDPALAEADQKKGDFNAIVVCAKDSDGRIFVLETIEERQNPTHLYSRFCSLHRRYSVQKAAIEDAGFQRILKFSLYRVQKEQNYTFPVVEQRPVGDKVSRIRSLIPFVESHELFVRKSMRGLIDQFKNFPQLPHDDVIDAVAACIPLFGLKNIPTIQEQRRVNRTQQRNLATRNARTGY